MAVHIDPHISQALDIMRLITVAHVPAQMTHEMFRYSLYPAHLLAF